jgi:hypothetical protein
MTDLAPIDILTDEEMQLAEALNMDVGMVELLRKCPVCKELILVTDNDVWLDPQPSVGSGSMGVVAIGGMKMAAAGALYGRSRHKAHDHQPNF